MAYIFLCGSDMDPVRIRKEYAGARFESIGSVAAEAVPELPGLDDRVWGILLRDDAAQGDDSIAVLARDGQELRARLASDAGDLVDRAAVIAQARYWELPVKWWQKLSES